MRWRRRPPDGIHARGANNPGPVQAPWVPSGGRDPLRAPEQMRKGVTHRDLTAVANCRRVPGERAWNVAAFPKVPATGTKAGQIRQARHLAAHDQADRARGVDVECVPNAAMSSNAPIRLPGQRLSAHDAVVAPPGTYARLEDRGDAKRRYRARPARTARARRCGARESGWYTASRTQ